MKRKAFLSIYKKAAPILPALGIIVAIGYCLAMKRDFEYSIHHFAQDSVWFWIFAVAGVIAFAISATLSVLPMKTVAIVKSPIPSPAGLFATILCTVMCIGTLITETKVGPEQIISPMQKLGGILCIFIAITFAMSCVKKYRGGIFHKIASILGLFSVNAAMFACYFDFSEPLNGPVRNITTIMQAAVILILISETRLAFGVPAKRVTSVLYIFSSCATSSLALGFSLGGILYGIFSSSSADPNLPLFRLGVYLAVAIFAVDRMIQLPAIAADAVNEPKE